MPREHSVCRLLAGLPSAARPAAASFRAAVHALVARARLAPARVECSLGAGEDSFRVTVNASAAGLESAAERALAGERGRVLADALALPEEGATAALECLERPAHYEVCFGLADSPREGRAKVYLVRADGGRPDFERLARRLGFPALTAPAVSRLFGLAVDYADGLVAGRKAYWELASGVPPRGFESGALALAARQEHARAEHACLSRRYDGSGALVDETLHLRFAPGRRGRVYRRLFPGAPPARGLRLTELSEMRPGGGRRVYFSAGRSA